MVKICVGIVAEQFDLVVCVGLIRTPPATIPFGEIRAPIAKRFRRIMNRDDLLAVGGCDDRGFVLWC